jgi:hypothetical protein
MTPFFAQLKQYGSLMTSRRNYKRLVSRKSEILVRVYPTDDPQINADGRRSDFRKTSGEYFAAKERIENRDKALFDFAGERYHA